MVGSRSTAGNRSAGERRRVLKKERGVLIFTFHHWRPKGWAALTRALQRAGFQLTGRYVVHSENPTSVHIVNLKALVHDAILVLTPTDTARACDWIRPEAIDRIDSEAFCRDFASALGWMLSAGLEDEEIQRQWFALL